MAQYAYPVLYALFVWWFSTALIIYLDNLPRHTFRWSMLGGTIVLAASLHRLASGATDTTVAGAYAAFTYAVLIWGWQEMSFFMGVVTGPRTAPCPPDSSMWQRFRLALAACLYHELAILAAAGAIIAVTWGQPNQVGLWTFVVLWLMRQSAKLNVFLGVLNLNEQFLPAHLAHLSSYMRTRPMNLLFPFSVTIGSAVLVWLAHRAVLPGVGTFEATGQTFVATMLALAVLEHWFLVLPVPFAQLWNWVLWLRDSAGAPHRRARRIVPRDPACRAVSAPTSR